MRMSNVNLSSSYKIAASPRRPAPTRPAPAVANGAMPADVAELAFEAVLPDEEALEAAEAELLADEALELAELEMLLESDDEALVRLESADVSLADEAEERAEDTLELRLD